MPAKSSCVMPAEPSELQRDQSHSINPSAALNVVTRSAPSATAARQSAARAVGSSGRCKLGGAVTVNGG